MNAKQRDVALQQWRSEIMRESRDLASLERVAERVRQDRDVRGDATLESLIRAELQQRRAEIERERQSVELANRQSRPERPSEYAERRTAGTSAGEHHPRERHLPPPTVALPDPTPAADPDDVALGQLVADLGEALREGDEDGARAALAPLRALHERNDRVISASKLELCEQRVEKLRARLQEFRGQIGTIAQDAVAAAGRGDEQAVAKLTCRLSAIHVNRPQLLDERGLKKIHRDILGASEGRQDRLTTRRLIDRERAVAGMVKRLAAAVNDFHRIAHAVPNTSAEFRRAEEVYLQALQESRVHEEDWLAEFVLEAADVLAEWSVSPPGAEDQIDCFVERIRMGIERIRAQMGQIDRKREK